MFDEMDITVDEEEHSIELHLPYIMQVACACACACACAFSCACACARARACAGAGVGAGACQEEHVIVRNQRE